MRARLELAKHPLIPPHPGPTALPADRAPGAWWDWQSCVCGRLKARKLTWQPEVTIANRMFNVTAVPTEKWRR